MATQGMVVISQGGRVVMKIIVGTDGGLATDVADAIRKLDHLPTLEEAYELAEQIGFGTPEDLVVMNETDAKFEGGELIPRYRETFEDPDFNPRWKHGTCEYIEVVEFVPA